MHIEPVHLAAIGVAFTTLAVVGFALSMAFHALTDIGRGYINENHERRAQRAQAFGYVMLSIGVSFFSAGIIWDALS